MLKAQRKALDVGNIHNRTLQDIGDPARTQQRSSEEEARRLLQECQTLRAAEAEAARKLCMSEKAHREDRQEAEREIRKHKEASEEAQARAVSLDVELQRCRLNEGALTAENTRLKSEKKALEISLNKAPMTGAFEADVDAQHVGSDSAAPASSTMPLPESSTALSEAVELQQCHISEEEGEGISRIRLAFAATSHRL
jgi:seryl-tRNA synthetase